MLTTSMKLRQIINTYAKQFRTYFDPLWTGLKWTLQTGALTMGSLYIINKLPKDIKYQAPVFGISGYLLYKQLRRYPG